MIHLLLIGDGPVAQLVLFVVSVAVWIICFVGCLYGLWCVIREMVNDKKEEKAIMTDRKALLIRLERPTLATLERKADEMGITTTMLIRMLCNEFAENRQIIHREPETQTPQVTQ